MRIDKLSEYQKYEEKSKIIGWDFSFLEGKTADEKIPWSYKEIIFKYLKNNDLLLDQGTAAGEFLLTLKHPYENTWITEGYAPNYKLCEERLAPLGIKICNLAGDEITPFENDFFDIIINRHESYNPQEVKRILKPNGLFITQQVGSKNNQRMREIINNYSEEWDSFVLEKEIKKFVDLGFEIVYKNEALLSCKYFTMEAVIFMAKIIAWEFHDFNVVSNYESLKRIDDEIVSKGYFESFEHRFIMVCINKE